MIVRLDLQRKSPNFHVLWYFYLTTSHGIPSSKSQVWHGCLHGQTFWGEARDLCWKLGRAIIQHVKKRVWQWKARPNSQHKSRIIFLQKIITNVNHTWMLGLANMSWTWNLGPHVNMPLVSHRIKYVTWKWRDNIDGKQSGSQVCILGLGVLKLPQVPPAWVPPPLLNATWRVPMCVVTIGSLTNPPHQLVRGLWCPCTPVNPSIEKVKNANSTLHINLFSSMSSLFGSTNNIKKSPNSSNGLDRIELSFTLWETCFTRIFFHPQSTSLPFMICAIRSTLQLGCIFTHANHHLGSKPYHVHVSLFILPVNNHNNQILHVFCYCDNKL